jgi:putative phosphoesterase
MRIGILSDLHVDRNNPGQEISVQEAVSRVAVEQGADLLLVAGDVSNDYELTIGVLREIEDRAGMPCLFVPGNHDLWNVEHPELNAWSIYEKLQAFERNLAAEPYRINEEWIVIGDAGWYDFSFGDSRYGEDEFLKMERGQRVWKDKLYARWDRSPIEMSRFFRLKLRAQLERFKDRKIVLATHVVPHPHFTVATPHPVWDYFNAFLGSRSYGDLIREFESSVRFAVSGHVHYRKRIRVGGTELICNCLGDKPEWQHSERAYDEVSRAFVTVDLE